MARLTPEEAAEKLATRLKASIDEVRKGVEKVTESPTAKAAAKKEKMLAKLTEAVNNGTWERSLKAVTLEEWKKTMVEKGINRIAAGVDAAKPKLVDFYNQLFPYQDSLRQKVNALPDLTLEDSIRRASEWIRGMSKFKKK